MILTNGEIIKPLALHIIVKIPRIETINDNIFLSEFNKKQKYLDGKKVANTKYIKETEYYKSKVRMYKFFYL